MTLILILTKGLPASGKSTWARSYLEQHPNTANLTKDELRLQLADCETREGEVIRVRDVLTRHYLSVGYSVIWSDTNFNPIHEEMAITIAQEYQAELKIQDFTMVDRQECVRRDRLRANPVGEWVINQMYEQYLAPARRAEFKV